MMPASPLKAIRGHVIQWTGRNPFVDDPAECIRDLPRGIILVEDGRITDVGTADEIDLTGIPVEDHGDKIIIPGFIDTHLHFPQTEMIGSFGKQLLDWLNTYTFPTEMEFADPDHAARVAKLFVNELLRNGTTTCSAFCSVHPGSVEALFSEAASRNMRMIAGKVGMDRNAPEGLLDTAQSAYDDSKALIERWHGRGRIEYSITPRFCITSTPEQLEAMGALAGEYRDCHIQSHIDENLAEIDFTLELYPGHETYAHVYAHYGLLREKAIYGHAVHMPEAGRALFAETGTAISHCPTSNMFLGSGNFRLHDFMTGDTPIRCGLATDVGAGTSFSMLVTLNEAYKAAQLNGHALSAVQGFWLATQGSARSLHIDRHVGNIAMGLEADLTVLDPKCTQILAARTNRANSLDEALFALMTMGDDRAIAATYVAGNRISVDTEKAKQAEAVPA